jgi:long-chain acyl-CoA synthetase
MNWPARDHAETLAVLTAPGAPFEMTTAEVAGRPSRVYVQARSDLAAVFDESRRFGDREFLIFEGERLSFEAHWRAATAFGRALVGNFGVGKGDRVAIAMRNYPEWSICAWGILSVGAVLTPLNAWEPGPSLQRMLEDSGATVCVLDGERQARMAGLQVAANLIVVRGEADPCATPLVDLIGAAADYSRLPDQPLPHPGLRPDDPATLFYTSGTTGLSKGALGSHRNATNNLVNAGIRAARAAVRRGDPCPPSPSPGAMGPARRQLLPLPLFHVTAFHAALVPALAHGNTLALMYRWEVHAALDLIARERLQALTLVPTLAWQLVDAIGSSASGPECVDTVTYGGAAAAPELAARVRRAFPGAFPGQGYGATETSSFIAANSGEDFLARPDSVGQVVPCCDMRVIDAAGRVLPHGEVGELLIYGPNVISGYWNAADATAAAFVDGWYRTGDIGLIDHEGFVRILDRAKDMLIRGGENIYCVEIEDVLASHPAVAEAAVFGVPERTLGEVVGAVVHLRAGHPVSERALKQFVRERLAPHKVPALLRFREEPLPRNAAGKTLKRDLRAQILSPVEDAN